MSRLGVAEAILPRSIKRLIPELAASLPEPEYSESGLAVSFWMDDVYVSVYEDHVLVHRVEDKAQAEVAMRRLDDMLSRLTGDTKEQAHG